MRKLFLLLISASLLFGAFIRDDAKEIVIDTISGLMFQDDIASSTIVKQWVTSANYAAYNFYDTSGDTASSYCDNLTLGGYYDWKLPNKYELANIMDSKQFEFGISEAFVNKVVGVYWTSSPADSYDSTRYPNSAWILSFGTSSYQMNKNNNYHVRCVRNLTNATSTAKISDLDSNLTQITFTLTSPSNNIFNFVLKSDHTTVVNNAPDGSTWKNGCVSGSTQFIEITDGSGDVMVLDNIIQNGGASLFQKVGTCDYQNVGGLYAYTISNIFVTEKIPLSLVLTNSISSTTLKTAISMTASLSTSAQSYLWDFGDNSYSTQQNPTHIYLKAGTFTVTCKATATDGRATTKSFIITVSEPSLSVISLSQYNLVKNTSYSLPVIIKSVAGITNPTLSATGLPTGMTLVNKGSFYTVEGTPTTNGTYNIALTASATGTSSITKNIQIVVEELTVSKITNPIVQVNQTDDTTYANTAGYKVTQPLSFKMSFNQPEKVASVKFYFLDINGTKVENDYDAVALDNRMWDISLPEAITGWVLFGTLPKSTDTRARVKAISFKVTTTDNRVVELSNALPLFISYVGLIDGNWISWNRMNNDAGIQKAINTFRIAEIWTKQDKFGDYFLNELEEYHDYMAGFVGARQGQGCFDINDKMFCSWDVTVSSSMHEISNDTSKIAVKTGDRIRVYPESVVFLKLDKHEYVMNTMDSEDTTEFVVDVNNTPDFAQGFFGNATQLYLKAISYIYQYNGAFGNASEGFNFKPSQEVITGVRGTSAVISKDINGTFDFKTYEGIIDVTKSGQTKTITTGNKLSSFEENIQPIGNRDFNLYEMIYFNSTSDYIANPQDYMGSVHVTTNDDNATFMIIGRNVIFGGGTTFTQEELSEGNYTLKFLPIAGKTTPPEIPFTISKEALNISLDGNYSDGLKLNDGWSLMGLGTDINVTNTQWNTLFGSAKIVWKYKDGTWKAYSSFDTIKSTINTAGYTLFDTINAGEGVWVQSDTNQTLAIDTNEGTYQLSIPSTKGWHLKATPKELAITSFTANRTDIIYVWTYNNGTWALWAKDGLQRGFESFDTIDAHKGFWVLVK